MPEREKEMQETDGPVETAARKAVEKEGEPAMLPIWFWIGSILLVYGAIVAAIGVWYVFHPQTRTVLAHINPNLWWGAIMLVVGLIFFLPNLRFLRR